MDGFMRAPDRFSWGPENLEFLRQGLVARCDDVRDRYGQLVDMSNIRDAYGRSELHWLTPVAWRHVLQWSTWLDTERADGDPVPCPPPGDEGMVFFRPPLISDVNPLRADGISWLVINDTLAVSPMVVRDYGTEQPLVMPDVVRFPLMVRDGGYVIDDEVLASIPDDGKREVVMFLAAVFKFMAGGMSAVSMASETVETCPVFVWDVCQHGETPAQ